MERLYKPHRSLESHLTIIINAKESAEIIIAKESALSLPRRSQHCNRQGVITVIAKESSSPSPRSHRRQGVSIDDAVGGCHFGRDKTAAKVFARRIKEK